MARIDEQILIAGGILLVAVASARRHPPGPLPRLLITFLGLGMLLGSDGLGGIYFDDAELARSIGILGLIAILFEGGLTTSWRTSAPVLAPGFLLSTVGVRRDAPPSPALAAHLSSTSRGRSRSCSAPSSARPTPPPSSRRFASRMLRRRLATRRSPPNRG